MSAFNEAEHPRASSGEFVAKTHGEPGALTVWLEERHVIGATDPASLDRPSGVRAIDGGVRNGLAWCIAAGPAGCVNGYVRLPQGHPLADATQSECAEAGLVGITWNRDGWIGFDTAGQVDHWPDSEIEKVKVLSSRRPGLELDEELQRVLNAEPYETSPPPDGGPKQVWNLHAVVGRTQRLADEVAATNGPQRGPARPKDGAADYLASFTDENLEAEAASVKAELDQMLWAGEEDRIEYDLMMRYASKVRRERRRREKATGQR